MGKLNQKFKLYNITRQVFNLHSYNEKINYKKKMKKKICWKCGITFERPCNNDGAKFLFPKKDIKNFEYNLVKEQIELPTDLLVTRNLVFIGTFIISESNIFYSVVDVKRSKLTYIYIFIYIYVYIF